MSTATQQAPQEQTTQQPNVLDEVLAQGVSRESLLQLRMEHESIMAECRIRRRDLKDILAELEGRMLACPELAKAAIYSKPIGTVFEITCDCGCRYEVGVNKQGYNKSPRHEECERCGKWAPAKQRELKKKARNLSIRMAEELAEIYGFNRVHAGLSIVDANHVKLTASFFDYQKLRSWVSEAIVSRLGMGKGGQTYVIAEDRFYSTIVKSEQSKVIREAILRSVSQTLKLRAFALAERITAESLKDEEVDKAVAAFAQKGVTLPQLESFVGKTRKEGWTKADRLELMEAWNALKDNEATVAELFGDDQPQNAQKKPPASDAGGASVDDLLKKPESPKQEAPSEDPLAAEERQLASDQLEREYVADHLPTLKSETEIRGMNNEAAGRTDLTDDAKARIKAACDGKIKEIKDNRGQRSNRGQKSMIGE